MTGAIKRWLVGLLGLAACNASAPAPDAVIDARGTDLRRAEDSGAIDTRPLDAADATAILPFLREGRSWALRQIDPIGGAPIFPTVALGPGGPVVAFRKGTADERYPVVSRFEGAAWSPPETIERQSETFLGKRPAVGIDPSGGLHVIYYNEDATRLRYARRPTGGPPWTLAYPYDPPGADAGDNAVLRLDGQGRLHCTFLRYRDYQTIYGRREADSWRFAPLARDGTPVKTYEATLAVSAAGQAHLVYADDQQRMYYAMGGFDGWTHEAVDTETPDIGHYLDGALDPAGRMHVIYLQWTRDHPSVWVARRRANGWQTDQVDTELGIAYAAALIVLADGTELIAYARNLGEGGDGLWFGFRRRDDGGWSLELVDGTTYVSGIDLAADDDGTLYLIYFDETNYVLRSAILPPAGN